MPNVSSDDLSTIGYTSGTTGIQNEQCNHTEP